MTGDNEKVYLQTGIYTMKTKQNGAVEKVALIIYE